MTTKTSRAVETMGTVVTIDVYSDGVSQARLEVLLGRAEQSLKRADEVFSTWKEQSPLSRLRRGEVRVEDLPGEVSDVLEACKRARSLSGGWFNPWMARGGVDPTGYVKGWAAQRALAALVFPGVVGAVVNAAGDIASFGSTGDGEPLRFGVVEPGQLHKLAFVVAHSGAVATSGTYERGAHLYDPGNGEAACRVASATVTGAELGMTDALATALAVGGETVLALVEAAEGFEGMLIGADGARQATSGFPYAGDQ